MESTKLERMFDYIAAQKWLRIVELAGYSVAQESDLTPGIVAQALRTALPPGYGDIKMSDACNGSGGGWCDCGECED